MDRANGPVNTASLNGAGPGPEESMTAPAGTAEEHGRPPHAMGGRRTDVSHRPAHRGAAWGVLLASALLEVVWAFLLKESDGFTHPGMAAAGMATAVVSLGMLSFALRDLPVGTAYAVWVGIGTVGIAGIGMAALGEPTTWPRVLFIALIAFGVVCLAFTDRRQADRAEATKENRTPLPPEARGSAPWHG